MSFIIASSIALSSDSSGITSTSNLSTIIFLPPTSPPSAYASVNPAPGKNLNSGSFNLARLTTSEKSMPSPLSISEISISSSSCSPAAINPAKPERPPMPAASPLLVNPLPNKLLKENPALGSLRKNFCNIPDFVGPANPVPNLPPIKYLPNEEVLNPAKGPTPPNKPAPPANIAALPIGLLTTFFTAFLAFLKTFFKKYDLIPVPLISSPAPPNDFKSAASSGLIYAKDSPGGAIFLASSKVIIPPLS